MRNQTRRDFLKTMAFATASCGAFSLLPSCAFTDKKGENVAIESELWQIGASDLADAIRKRIVTSQEVVQAHLERIKAINGQLNAVTLVLEEESLRAAKEADMALNKGAVVGPLHGVPMTIKENIDLAGSPTTVGVVAYKNRIAQVDAPHIAQLKRAGAIPIARTNLPDMGLRWHTDSGLRGATRNPWDSSLTPGGSTGGEAVALATGMTPLGLGNDYGGSLRYPAQCCGITSIRPSRGRVAYASSFATQEFPMTLQFFYVQGPMARNVADLRLALRNMSGPDARDPWWTPAPLEGQNVAEPIKVALSVDPGNQGVDPDVANGVRKAAQVLVDAGYIVEEMDPPAVQEAAELWAKLVGAEVRVLMLDNLKKVMSSDALKFLNQFLAGIPEIGLATYMREFADRNAIARKWTQFAERYPLILGPISTMPPFPVGRDLAGVDAVKEIRDSLRLVVSVNLLGLPAVVVPVGLSKGIPQGVQIIGPMCREDLCFDAAERIERILRMPTPIEPN
jgi:amidase